VATSDGDGAVAEEKVEPQAAVVPALRAVAAVGVVAPPAAGSSPAVKGNERAAANGTVEVPATVHVADREKVFQGNMPSLEEQRKAKIDAAVAGESSCTHSLAQIAHHLAFAKKHMCL
jgi:hypothetical protein